MSRKNKQLLMYAAVGFGAWWFFTQRTQTPAVTATVVSPLPTDSMMPGVMPAAVNGIVKEGEGLSYLGMF